MNAKRFLLHLTTLFCVLFVAAKAVSAPQLNGIAIHEELGAEQFIAAVYSETPTSSSSQLLLANENKVMEIRILAEQLYSRRFKRLWVEGIAINAGPSDLERHAQDLADFTQIIRVKLKQGDILRISRITGKGTVISINGLHLGTINNTRFFDLLLRTWVGPVPLSSDFKQTMLANGHVSKRILSRFESISPNPERLSSLAKALELEKTQETADKAIAAKTESNAKTDDASAPILATSTPTAPIISAAATTISTSASIGATASDLALSKVNKQDQTTPANNSTTKTPSKPPTQIASIPKTTQGISEELFEGDDIFNDDNDKDSFSAESLLSEQLYISKLTKWTSQFVKYPRYSVNRNQEGTVRVTVVLARNGKVTDIEITDKSVHDQLNKAAKTAISEASPYPSMPEDLKGDVFRFTVPVVFRLN